MNFGGCISDDAQFFFEDYNFYHNATSVPNQQPVVSVPQVVLVQENMLINNNGTPMQNNDILLSTTLSPSRGSEEFNDFSTLISDALNDNNRNRNRSGNSGYVSPYELSSPPNGIQDQSQHEHQRAESVFDDKKNLKIANSKSPNPSNKVCRVCGDKALGYNFNVVTCESCKAFFRRNALKKKKLQCPFQNRCTITVSSRRYCQKCRLRKCFEVGMKAEYIMTEEQRAQKRQRLLERETLEINGQGNSSQTTAPGSPGYQDSVFLSHDNNNSETRNRYDSFATTVSNGLEPKPVLSSKSSSASSTDTLQQQETYSTVLPTNPSSITSAIDVAAWVEEIPQLKQTLQLSSPVESDPNNGSINAMPTSLETEDDMITIRIPKSALLGILFNNNDRTQQMTALGQAVVASAASSNKLLGRQQQHQQQQRSSGCVCPCTCAYNRASIIQSSQAQQNFVYPMDAEQIDYGLTAESHMAGNSMQDQMFSLFPTQYQQQSTIDNLDSNQISMSSLSVNDTENNNQLVLSSSMGNVNSGDYSASSISMDFDLDILNSLTNAFDVDWQLPMPMPFPSFVNVNFNLKYAKLDELLLANEEWNLNCQVCPILASTVSELSAQDFFNLIHYALRCVIKQHNRLSAFKNLALEDQQALIKASVRELVTLRSIMRYDTKMDLVNVQYPGREFITLEIAKRVRGGVYNQMKELIASYPEKWRKNEALMLILSAVVLFNPEAPHVVNKQAVEAEQRNYLQLLKDYLENTYGADEARQAYNFLTERVSQLIPWVQNYSLGLLFELDPRTMEPMLVEIFDVDFS